MPARIPLTGWELDEFQRVVVGIVEIEGLYSRGALVPIGQHLGSSRDLFLGIDHTAIAVADTERSLSFYRDELGFRISGESLNYGAEQDHLNHVFGSKVRITSLRSTAGPGIEFLEYLVPRNGRQTRRVPGS